MSGLSPDVPAGEVEARLARLQGELRAAGLAGALILQAADLYYFTGTSQDALLAVPADGDPALLVRRSLMRAKAESPLAVIERLPSRRDLRETLVGLGLTSGTLGLELDVLPTRRYLEYASLLEGFDLQDCSHLIRRLRTIKSAWELSCIRRAGDMLRAAAESVPEIAYAGITELGLAAALEFRLRREGHQGLARVRAFNQETFYGVVAAGPAAALPGAADGPVTGIGPNAAIGKGASQRPIEPGEPIIVDLVAGDSGYLADQTRTFSFGPLSSHLRDAYDAATDILRALERSAIPGISPASLWEEAVSLAGERVANFMGFGDDRVSFVGHGIGLELDELPILAPRQETAIEEAMTLAIEPKFVFPDEGAVGIENTYVVTTAGLQPLTTASEQLIEL